MIHEKLRCKETDGGMPSSHVDREIPIPEGSPKFEILDETPFAIFRQKIHYYRCVYCGRIFIAKPMSEGDWVWKKAIE